MKTLFAYTLKWLAGWLVLTFVAVAAVHQAWIEREYPVEAAQPTPVVQAKSTL